ncbi:PREDICTED: uncharacterized protein LOC106816821 [Priapulus caudatus]|uniref:Uncharacterized protein LOC106816821 n=1 Tax=Priapulus caudatus TaxID=37621 RepID=A0ABM1EXM1_PRICU|nr:PREDICTED: uncharacterized protein LOC106816821 [Priapulus caudatus]XP_014676941.1 PREDICTED: uncharacterized protein LOC106816821 [Priapulus caudatus]XP_014676942.1 PREDICTED: uncharacterized protein LOC106816821 [Priapulus caudatus]
MTVAAIHHRIVKISSERTKHSHAMRAKNVDDRKRLRQLLESHNSNKGDHVTEEEAMSYTLPWIIREDSRGVPFSTKKKVVDLALAKRRCLEERSLVLKEMHSYLVYHKKQVAVIEAALETCDYGEVKHIFSGSRGYMLDCDGVEVTTTAALLYKRLSYHKNQLSLGVVDFKGAIRSIAMPARSDDDDFDNEILILTEALDDYDDDDN